MDRWYRSISDTDDLIDFKNHIRAVSSQIAKMGDREFPASIYVSGSAYYPLKTKAKLEHERQSNALGYVVKGLFNFGATIIKDIGSQLFDYASEAYSDRNDAAMKAASVISTLYNVITEDSGTSMELKFFYQSDPDNAYEDPPGTY